MAELDARGLDAGWLNAWLAAIGATVLVPDLTLGWTDGPNPHARFHHHNVDIAPAIAAALPTVAEFESLAIARHHRDANLEFPRQVSAEIYADRAIVARRHGDASLAASLTDLRRADKGRLDNGPFDTPASTGRTLWDRLMACAKEITDPLEQLNATLAGTARRVEREGLGFDHRSFLSPADPSGGCFVDPVVEILAFVALTLLPTRGDGTRPSNRGWSGPPSKPGAFSWPTWTEPLGAAGIDALLDRFWAAQEPAAHGYSSVPYAPRSSNDNTRGYASRPLQ